jgi:hypothetical protein
LSLAIRRARKAALRITALTVLTVLAGASAALASCPVQPVSTPFSQWGDTSDYFLVPGGSFEGTSDQVGWSLSGATLSAGNEPFFVNGTTDGQLLSINGGGSATSPYFCVDSTMGSLRFFAQQSTAGSDLQVEALVQTPSGDATVPVADLADGSMPSWAPTQVINGRGTLPNNDSVMVALHFTAPSSAGSWQVDDVYVDPYRSG